MRGQKETVGSIKAGTKSKSRTVGQSTSKVGTKMSVKTSGKVSSGHGGVSSRKTTTGKGGSHK